LIALTVDLVDATNDAENAGFGCGGQAVAQFTKEYILNLIPEGALRCQ
jgi:hypothetical protein